MNQLRGKITEIETDGNISLVTIEAEEIRFSSTVIDTTESASYLNVGSDIYMVFKETEMAIGKNLSGGLSLRNRFVATITTIILGKVLAKVEIDFKGHRLHSIITARSARNLDLKIGDQVEGIVKTTEISLMEITG